LNTYKQISTLWAASARTKEKEPEIELEREVGQQRWRAGGGVWGDVGGGVEIKIEDRDSLTLKCPVSLGGCGGVADDFGSLHMSKQRITETFC